MMTRIQPGMDPGLKTRREAVIRPLEMTHDVEVGGGAGCLLKTIIDMKCCILMFISSINDVIMGLHGKLG